MPEQTTGTTVESGVIYLELAAFFLTNATRCHQGTKILHQLMHSFKKVASAEFKMIFQYLEIKFRLLQYFCGH